ncbi:sialate O-acetylesterase [Defluviimonas sp. WL0075]|uniref:Sialate O-acetylesterase n=1 Tax=Albidovulum sediminicola TaxID=2984331 RepID=A0ABT2YW91_9RHOB|nr:sialate O-acetylesterase [Defluviimonas sp. WL0075]MCV2863141.1 sialate O-acetylesterase [Defluviimonas sp. WL0075]
MLQIGINLGDKPHAHGATPGPAPHVFVIAGEANASGRAPEDDATAFPAIARHWSAANAWEPIGSRLCHGPWETAAIARPDPLANFGWARAFASAYQAAHPENPVHLVGVARAGSGFATSQWVKGSAEYNAAIARVNAAMAEAPAGAILKGILWHQGEADSQTQAARDSYEAALNQLITDLRADVTGAGASTPFVLGGHFPKSTLYHSAIQNVCQSRPNQVSHTGYADPSTPSEGTLASLTEADAPTVAALGQSYVAGLAEAAGNAPLGSGGAITLGTITQYALPRLTQSTLSGVSLGTPSPDRLILIAVSARAAAAVTPLSVTVGGVALTRAGTHATDAGLSGTSLFYGRVPEGTSAAVTVKLDSLPGSGQSAIAVLPVHGARPHLANALGQATTALQTTGIFSISAPVSVQPGDLVFAAAAAYSPALATGVIDLSQSVSGSYSGGYYGVHCGAELQIAAGMRTVTCSFDQGVSRASINALVLRPA